MTTEQTNESNGAPKKPRKNSKVTKRIAELESDYAVALASGNADEATRLRACVARLENGESEEAPPVEETVEASADAATVEAGADAKPTTWNDVVAASVEAEANRTNVERVFDRILVDLTDTELAELGDKHVDADAKLATVLSEKKEAMADFKAQIAEAESDKRKIAETIKKKKALRDSPTEGWICEETFATNTRVYRDPKTGAVVCTEAMGANERQLALPKVSDEASAKAAQLSLGDVEPTDATTCDDPEALLAAAQQGEAAEDEGRDDDDQGDGDGDDEDGDR
jgi:hypothetical protein